ncbi:response regulator transcription factor [Pseudomonas lactis]|uniref:Transcriptional regulator, LuxR family n=1 Tax=Pseudomonas lactis TaxID=1615674 RepID=I4KBF1_9PSED|nr:response regulator transcription factor [Pseudomonas lactis]EIK62041.1 transcriptional regulator, LuxR family [Pseudomonas lactis]TKJ93921.1 DNA-binding response regulator [Pseudomonas fluorescens]
MLSPIRVGVFDKLALIRYGLCIYLLKEPGVEMIGSYACSIKALHAARKKKLNVLVVGYVPGNIDCLEFVKKLVGEKTAPKLLVLLERPHPPTEVLLQLSGAHGILYKTQPLADYMDAIRRLAAGKFYFRFEWTLNCALELIDCAVKEKGVTPAATVSAMLSSRERDVLRLFAKGLTVTQIASNSVKSVKTISAQKRNAYRKLGLKNDLDFFKRLASLDL